MLDKTPSYLSPSSLSTIQKQPHKFFLTRCQEEPFLQREPQSLAAAVGTGFDCLVKIALHKNGVKFGTKIPFDQLDRAEEYFVEDLYSSLENHKAEAMEAGAKVLRVYKKAGLLGMTKVKWRSVEGQSNFIIPDTEVNLFGKLDAIVYDEDYGMEVPYDYKVSGYTAKSGMTPKKGYYEIFDNGWKGPHKSYTETIKMEDIDEGFAKQFATYGWMLGHYGKEFPVYFCHIVHNGDNSKIRIASYRAIVTTKFQEKLVAEYVRVWESLHNGEFEKGLISTDDLLACEIMSFGESWF